MRADTERVGTPIECTKALQQPNRAGRIEAGRKHEPHTQLVGPTAPRMGRR